MARLRIHSLMMSLDGFVAGPDQSVEEPMGVGSDALKTWVFADPRPPIDTEMLDAGTDGIGATVMGRNMFGPVRGPWPDLSWRGWWGEEPPYHSPVFVLTHHEREPLEMTGTTFFFVTDGIESALEQAFAAANGLDVRLGGGASTVNQYLRAGLVDDIHVAVVPALLGRGERPFDGVDLSGYERDDVVSSHAVAHFRLRKA